MSMPVQATKSNVWNRTRLFVLIVLIPAAMYITWLSHLYSDDDLQYAMLVERVTTGQPFYHPVGEHIYEPGYLSRVTPENKILPVNPRYLLEYPTSIAVTNLWRLFGYRGLAIAPVLALRILVGCLGLLFLTMACAALTRRPGLAALGCFGIAFSLAYWTYSTHLDQSINMIAIFALALYLLVRQQRKTGAFDSTSVAIPVLMSFATLYNFTAVIISGVISVVIVLTAPRLTWKTRLWRFVRYNLIYGAVLVTLLAGAISLSAGPQALVNPDYWAAVTFAGHPEYNVNLLNDTFRAIIGLEKSQITFPGAAGAFQAFWDQASGVQKIAMLAFYGVVGVLFALPFAYLLVKNVRGKTLTLPGNAPYLLLTAIFLAYSLFNLFWDPGYIKYWSIPLICWWLIAIGVIGEIQDSAARWKHVPLYLAIALVFFSISLNLIGVVARESRFSRNPWLEMAETLRDSPENALFVSNGSGLDFYIAYFTRRNVISLDLIQYANAGSTDAVRAVLDAQVRAHLQDGAPVYFYGFEPQNTWVDEIFDLAATQQAEPAWTFDALTIYRVVR